MRGLLTFVVVVAALARGLVALVPVAGIRRHRLPAH